MTHHKIQNIDRYNADLSFQGIPYADYDRTGHWAIWNIVKMFEAARLIAANNGFLDLKSTKIENNSTMVVMKQCLKLSPKIHEIAIFTPVDVRVVMKFKSMGKTSLIYHGNLINEHTQEQLGEIWLKYVQINFTTRRPLPFSANMKMRFSNFESEDVLLEMGKTEMTEKPRDAYIYTLDARHSDTDSNNHVNQAAYVRYCMDCATDAAANGFYQNFHSDMCLYPTTEWTMSYLGESFGNDILDVFTWQDKSNAGNIKFSIYKNQTIIFYAETVFDYSHNGHSKM